MGGGARFLLSVFLPVLLLPVPVGASVVVNELYYDHPGADAGYEFVEILNSGSEAVSLDGVTLEFHNGVGEGWTVIWRAPNGVVLPPDVPWVLGGAAVTPPPDAVFELALQNGPDSIRLIDAQGTVLDVAGYGGLDDATYVERLGVAPVDAGQSIARTPDGRDTGDNAVDFQAATPTPGRRNVARHDASPALADDVAARSGRDRAGIERLAVEVANLGLNDIPPGAVTVVARDSSATGASEVGTARTASTIPAGDAERVVLEVALSEPGYHWISIDTHYAPDERRANDRVSLVRRVGRPALLVSEIMSAPGAGCPQFVELYNAGDFTLDLTGWSLRDMRSKPARIAADEFLLASRESVVISADPVALSVCAHTRARVFDVDGSWPSFNKSGSAFADSVVVVDVLGIPVEGVAYPGVATGTTARSLERIDLFPPMAPRDAVWRLSRDSGGSPGLANAGALEVAPRTRCEVSPNPFFPTEGDLMRIAVAAVPGVASVVVRIYDPSGRRVREVGSATTFPAVVLWDGRCDGGEPVRAGVYVLACEAFGADGARVGVEKVVVGCATNRSP